MVECLLFNKKKQISWHKAYQHILSTLLADWKNNAEKWDLRIFQPDMMKQFVQSNPYTCNAYISSGSCPTTHLFSSRLHSISFTYCIEKYPLHLLWFACCKLVQILGWFQISVSTIWINTKSWVVSLSSLNSSNTRAELQDIFIIFRLMWPPKCSILRVTVFEPRLIFLIRFNFPVDSSPSASIKHTFMIRITQWKFFLF